MERWYTAVMTTPPSSHNSPWAASLTGMTHPPLAGQKTADVVVVGGGLVGVMTAYLLAKAGKKVVLLERDSIGAGETGATTALCTMLPDARLAALRRTFGNDRAAQALASGQAAIDLIEEIVKAEGIACDFRRCAAHVYAASEGDVPMLREEERLALRFGFPVAFRNGSGFERHGYLEVPAQAMFDPGKFLAALAERIIARGGQIHAGTPVTGFGGQDGATALTPSGSVAAGLVVVATHAPIDHRFEAPARLVGHQTYALAADIPKGSIAEGIYWDTARPYHYFRVDAGAAQDRIILGGEDHKTGQQADANAHANLEKYLHGLVGSQARVTHRWSGQVFETCDGLPFIGRSFFNRRHFIATGFAGNGITFGTLAAQIISDEIIGVSNRHAKLYSPRRLKGIATLMKNGVDLLRHFFGDRMRARSAGRERLAPGHGKVALIDGKRVAISCGPDGRCTAVSAVCTHLGCIVQWNTTERTWDCPCHGSRFKNTGEVLNGPAIAPLERFPSIEDRP